MAAWPRHRAFQVQLASQCGLEAEAHLAVRRAAFKKARPAADATTLIVTLLLYSVQLQLCLALSVWLLCSACVAPSSAPGNGEHRFSPKTWKASV